MSALGDRPPSSGRAHCAAAFSRKRAKGALAPRNSRADDAIGDRVDYCPAQKPSD